MAEPLTEQSAIAWLREYVVEGFSTIADDADYKIFGGMRLSHLRAVLREVDAQAERLRELEEVNRALDAMLWYSEEQGKEIAAQAETIRALQGVIRKARVQLADICTDVLVTPAEEA